MFYLFSETRLLTVQYNIDILYIIQGIEILILLTGNRKIFRHVILRVTSWGKMRESPPHFTSTLSGVQIRTEGCC
jgi:hypothetical protein